MIRDDPQGCGMLGRRRGGGALGVEQTMDEADEVSDHSDQLAKLGRVGRYRRLAFGVVDSFRLGRGDRRGWCRRRRPPGRADVGWVLAWRWGRGGDGLQRLGVDEQPGLAGGPPYRRAQRPDVGIEGAAVAASSAAGADLRQRCGNEDHAVLAVSTVVIGELEQLRGGSPLGGGVPATCRRAGLHVWFEPYRSVPGRQVERDGVGP